MRTQWGLILALIFALIIGVFSVVNVNDVTVDYIFGRAEWPLILIILGSVLMGALIVGLIGMVRVFRLQREVRRLRKENANQAEELEKNRNVESSEISDAADEGHQGAEHNDSTSEGETEEEKRETDS